MKGTCRDKYYSTGVADYKSESSNPNPFKPIIHNPTVYSPICTQLRVLLRYRYTVYYIVLGLSKDFDRLDTPNRKIEF